MVGGMGDGGGGLWGVVCGRRNWWCGQGPSSGRHRQAPPHPPPHSTIPRRRRPRPFVRVGCDCYGGCYYDDCGGCCCGDFDGDRKCLSCREGGVVVWTHG